MFRYSVLCITRNTRHVNKVKLRVRSTALFWWEVAINLRLLMISINFTGRLFCRQFLYNPCYNLALGPFIVVYNSMAA